jgi:hypothetical protein
MARRFSPAHRKSFHERGQALAKEFDDLFIAEVSLETAAFFPGMLDHLLAISPSSLLSRMRLVDCAVFGAVGEEVGEDTTGCFGVAARDAMLIGWGLVALGPRKVDVISRQTRPLDGSLERCPLWRRHRRWNMPLQIRTKEKRVESLLIDSVE